MRKAAVIGIGQSEYGRSLGRGARDLATDAVLLAVEDAALQPDEIDGIISFGGEFESVDIPTVHKLLGMPSLTLYAQVPFGGEAVAGAVRIARDAVLAGTARHVLIYRSISSYRQPRTQPLPEATTRKSTSVRGSAAFALPFGLASPAQSFALVADHYRREAGITLPIFEDALGSIAVTSRSYASTNPAAILRDKPLTLDGHHASRMISAPLRRDDMCLVNDGAAAIVVSRATSGRNGGVRILGATQNLDLYGEPFGIYTSSLSRFARPSTRVFAEAGIDAKRVRVAALYDASTITALTILEQTGLVEMGQAVPYILDVGLGPESPLPVNPHGGNLAEAYVHGLSGLLEIVRQLRGDAANPIRGADVGLFASPLGSAVVLGALA